MNNSTIEASDLVGRDDVFAFVNEQARKIIPRRDFSGAEPPEGIDAVDLWYLVEDVRHAACGVPVCGAERCCDHHPSWYALNPVLSSRVTRLERRCKPRGSFSREFARYLESTGFYAPRLEELSCALALDGIDVGADELRLLSFGAKAPSRPAELFAAGVLDILLSLPEIAAAPSTTAALEGAFRAIDANAEGVPFNPLRHPTTPVYSICERLDVAFVSEAMSGDGTFDAPSSMFVLFCSDALWKKPVFPRWTHVMELVIRGLFLERLGLPILSQVPLLKPFWAWENGMPGAYGDAPFGECMVETRHGHDMTPLFSTMLSFWEHGLDELARIVKGHIETVDRAMGLVEESAFLNRRQRELLRWFVQNPSQCVDGMGWGKRAGVAPSTAYADLHKLVEMGYLVMGVAGKAHMFYPARDMVETIIRMRGRCG